MHLKLDHCSFFNKSMIYWGFIVTLGLCNELNILAAMRRENCSTIYGGFQVLLSFCVTNLQQIDLSSHYF